MITLSGEVKDPINIFGSLTESVGKNEHFGSRS